MQDSENMEEEAIKKSKNVFIGACIFIAISIVGYACVMVFCNTQKWEERGQFGDMFGVVNALFSGLAFAGLIYTAMMQRIELKLQRDELVLQRKEMELNRIELTKQSEAQKATELTLKEQAAQQRAIQAEAIFFNLLNSIRSLVASTEGDVLSQQIDTYSNRIKKRGTGSNYYFLANYELQQRVWAAISKYLVFDVAQMRKLTKEEVIEAHERASQVYNVFFKEHSAELAHYFRFTFNVLNFVDTNADLTQLKKEQYVKFLQSQMSDSELQLLYFNGIGEHGKKYYDLMEKYDFLQNLNTTTNKGTIELLENFYPKSSFRE